MYTKLRLWSTWLLFLICLLMLLQPVSAQGQADSSPGCTPPEGWHQYTVQTGDTLSRLARAYGTTARAIARANCLMYQVQLGQTIFLPPVESNSGNGNQLQQGQPNPVPEADQDRDRLQERDRDQDCSQDCTPDQNRDQNQNRDRDRNGHK